jgi:hypothetical protein
MNRLPRLRVTPVAGEAFHYGVMSSKKKARLRYDRWDSGEAISLKKGDRLLLACCSCRLVHKMKFDTAGKDIRITIWRVEDETRRLRNRHPKIKITD